MGIAKSLMEKGIKTENNERHEPSFLGAAPPSDFPLFLPKFSG